MSDGLPQYPGLPGQTDGKPAIPIFFMETVPNPFRSQQEGRPCADEVEMVRLLIPGDKNSSPVKRVDDEDRAKYPKAYEAFKDGLEPPTDGTPLSEWPPISKSQVLELAHFHIKTVEHLAGVHDGQLQNMPMGTRALRGQAKVFIDVSLNGTAPIARLTSKIEELESDKAHQASVIEEMGARLAALEGKKANARSDHS